MTEISTTVAVTSTSRYAAWSAIIRRGFRSDNRFLAFLIRQLDIGVCPRPIVRWSPLLLALALTGTGLAFLDGVFTAFAISDPAHPFVVEAWGPTAKVLEVAGIPGMLVAKLAQALLLFFILDLGRLRGLRKLTLALGLVFTVVGVLLVANSLSILLSAPTRLY